MHVLSSPVPSALPVAPYIHARAPCRAAAAVLCRSVPVVLMGATPAGQRSVDGLACAISPGIPCDGAGRAAGTSPVDHPASPTGAVSVRASAAALSARASAARTRSHCAEMARVASVSTGVGAGRRPRGA